MKKNNDVSFFFFRRSSLRFFLLLFSNKRQGFSFLQIFIADGNVVFFYARFFGCHLVKQQPSLSSSSHSSLSFVFALAARHWYNIELKITTTTTLIKCVEKETLCFSLAIELKNFKQIKNQYFNIGQRNKWKHFTMIFYLLRRRSIRRRMSFDLSIKEIDGWLTFLFDDFMLRKRKWEILHQRFHLIEQINLNDRFINFGIRLFDND